MNFTTLLLCGKIKEGTVLNYVSAVPIFEPVTQSYVVYSQSKITI